MSYDLKKNKNTNDTIVYNFTGTDVYKSEMSQAEGYLYVPITNTSSSSNLTCSTQALKGSWFMQNIYAFKPLHQTSNPSVTADGELVIALSNSPGTGSKATLFACFFLQTNGQTNTSNAVDNLFNLHHNTLTSITNQTITLNTAIPKQKDPCVYYKDADGKHVLVFTTPIQINATTAGYLNNPDNKYVNTTSFFKGYSSESAGPITGYTSFTKVSQNQDEDIYIDCSPTGVSEKEITTYSLPVNSGLMDSKVKIDSAHQAIVLPSLLVLLFFIYMGGPWSYKTFIINPTKQFFKGKSVMEFTNRIKTIEMCIFLILLLIFVLSVIIGGVYGDKNSSNYGYLFIFCISYFLFVTLISFSTYNKKANPDFIEESIKTSFSYDNNIGDDITKKVNNFDDLWKKQIITNPFSFFGYDGADFSEFIGDLQKYLFSAEKRKVSYYLVVLVLFIVSVLIYGGVTGKMDATWRSPYTWLLLLFAYVIMSLVFIMNLKKEEGGVAEEEEEEEEQEDEEEEEEEQEDEEEED